MHMHRADWWQASYEAHGSEGHPGHAGEWARRVCWQTRKGQVEDAVRRAFWGYRRLPIPPAPHQLQSAHSFRADGPRRAAGRLVGRDHPQSALLCVSFWCASTAGGLSDAEKSQVNRDSRGQQSGHDTKVVYKHQKHRWSPSGPPGYCTCQAVCLPSDLAQGSDAHVLGMLPIV